MKLGGVIYLQSVESNWMIKTRRNLPMLRQLCGDNALARVVLGTTHWGEVDEDEGKMREQQLAKSFWGSKSLRFEQTKVSARAFLDFILGQLPVMMILYFFPLLSLYSLWTDSLYQANGRSRNGKKHSMYVICAGTRY